MCQQKHESFLKNFLEENTKENLSDIGYGSGSLELIPKAEATKEKIDEMSFIKIKNFGFREKGQSSGGNPQNRENISKSYICQSLLCEYLKNSVTQQQHKTNSLWKKYLNI